MALYGADVFLDLVMSERTLWIRGIKGGNKTSLSYYLAHSIFQKDKSYRYLIGNCPSVWQEELNNTELRKGKYLDCIVILDEGGRWLRTRDLSEEFVDFCRKLNTIWIIPSVSEPYRSFRKLTCQQIHNLRSVGLDASIYKWIYKDGSAVEDGKFLWWHKSEIHGIFDTDTAVIDDGGIMDWIIEQKTKSGIIKKAASKALQQRTGQFSIQILDVAEEIQDSVEQLERVQTVLIDRKSRKKV